MASTHRPISAAGATFKINGKKVGQAQNVTVSETITNVAMRELGDIDVDEHVPVTREVTMSCSVVRFSRRSQEEQGVWPRGDTAAVLAFPPMVAELWNKTDGEPLWFVEGVKPQSRSMSVDVGGILMVNADFVATRLYDEQGAGGSAV